MPNDSYQYFNIDKIIDSFGFTEDQLNKGRKLANSDKFRLGEIQVGYLRNNDNMVCDTSCRVNLRNNLIDTRVIFDKDTVIRTECDCNDCAPKMYRFWSSEKLCCRYIAGLLLKTKEQLAQDPRGDATTYKAVTIFHELSEKRFTRLSASGTDGQSIALEPYLKDSTRDLELCFRIVEKKALIIKDLIEFIDNVDNAATAVYGSKTSINHKIDNFDSRSREWIAFIREVLQEENRLRTRIRILAEHNYMAYNERKCGSLVLYGWRLDRFYEILGSDAILFEESVQEGGSKKKLKHQLTCLDTTPEVPLHITPDMDSERNIFQGIHVAFSSPVFYSGTDCLYYIRDEHLCRTARGQFNALEPLLGHASNGSLEFNVGRARLQEFYYSVLPQLGSAVQVIEDNSDLIRKYLPAEVEFCFYLDASEGDVTCKVHAIYEGSIESGQELREISITSDMDEEKPWNGWRMHDREHEVLYTLQNYFPVYIKTRDELSCDGNEDNIFKLLESGLSVLEEIGEVRGTDRFRNMNAIRRPKISVGVSVESSLLDLVIDTDDISPEELLEILHSYKLKKRYYRLKSGSFINMDDDGLKMLDELCTSMQITDKEILKQNIHLPVYRTLYLNRLLEDNDNIYNSRDSRFRDMVRRFKTVRDADYEVPSSLKSTLRGYQATGYKWLRTLMSCGFGGILADEMGLGKTLQTIAVLLALKLEGPSASHRVSLVVSPASLVYNWCEEFGRFAPELSVLPVTGTSSERAGLLESWKDYDVLVTSYDLLKRDIARYEDKTFSVQIIDEAQYIKNHTTAASKAVKVIRADNRLALTGTPVENRLSELWSIFDFLMPGFLYRYETFKKQFETPIVKNQDQDAMARLRKMTGPFILRRLKSEVLKDLPDKLEENRFFKMEGEQRRLYDAQVVRMQQRLAEESDEDFQKKKLQILAELTRLRQICCDPSLCFEDYKGGSAKLDGCMELIASAVDAGHKVLLFSQFVSMLELIQSRLASAKLDYYCITGSTPKENRLKMVKSFNSDSTPVFLVSLKAGGVGLNLTGADVVIHYDPWWNLAVQNQATDRAHRIGQTKKVTVYKLLTTASIEERIQKLQESKKDLAEQILNAGEGQLTRMSKDELMELLNG